MSREGALCIFEGDGKGNVVAEGLGYADTILAGVNKADGIRGVDGSWAGLGGLAEVVILGNSRPVLRQHTPFLAADEAPAIVKLGLSPRLAKAKSVTVG